MAQADGIVSNGSGAAVRADINNQLAAVFTNHSGTTEPTTTYAYQFWADTTNNLLKIRNSTNTGWVTLRQLDGEFDTLPVENGTNSAPSIYFKDSGTDSGFYSPGTDQVAVSTVGVQRVNFNAATEVVFNDTGADVDFRIEGDTEENLFVIDAGTNEVRVKNLNGGPLAGARNRIINGDMRIDQRNGGASVTPTTDTTYVLDRFSCRLSVSSKYAVQRNRGSVTPPAGFTNYLGVGSLSAYSVGASEFFAVEQNIEGFNVADLGWGTANAQTVTLSFRVQSSLTGTFGGTIFNQAGNRSYPFSYSISAANTWTTVAITIPGDTSGTWVTDNTGGTTVSFSLGAGSTVSETANAWSGLLFRSATGATSVVGTNGATFYITGVQLEPGSVATPFERRSVGQELALCQRYYQAITSLRIAGYTTTGAEVSAPVGYMAAMRAIPVSTVGGFTSNNVATATVYATNMTATGGSIRILAGGTGSLSAYDGYFYLSAEL